MRYIFDQCGNVVVDHGLGVLGQVRLPPRPPRRPPPRPQQWQRRGGHRVARREPFRSGTDRSGEWCYGDPFSQERHSLVCSAVTAPRVDEFGRRFTKLVGFDCRCAAAPRF